ncbi:hypothetical protein QUF70_03020 [Desulfobacterales bacterium HSG17]|nr:hypothetical protein [Desulfobacterales bacterium HSG17]
MMNRSKVKTTDSYLKEFAQQCLVLVEKFNQEISSSSKSPQKLSQIIDGLYHLKKQIEVLNPEQTKSFIQKLERTIEDLEKKQKIALKEQADSVLDFLDEDIQEGAEEDLLDNDDEFNEKNLLKQVKRYSGKSDTY